MSDDPILTDKVKTTLDASRNRIEKRIRYFEEVLKDLTKLHDIISKIEEETKAEVMALNQLIKRFKTLRDS